MPKNNKREKHLPNFVVFLVEGDSDTIVLETSLSDLIFEKYPDYEVRFLLQQKKVNRDGTEVNDSEDDSEDDGYIEEDEYKLGGDITTSSFVEPGNIETKITNRFIKPATRTEGLYPKLIAKIIHIVDLDGTYIPDDHVVPLSQVRANDDSFYYDGDKGVIEAPNVEDALDRNRRKRENLDYLLSLPDQKIKIGTRKIPYEIYYFSSNMDHFVNHDANPQGSKKGLADKFLRETICLETEAFCKFFIDDEDSMGSLGYQESWDEIKKGTNSVKRHTNIDCLIRSLIEK